MLTLELTPQLEQEFKATAEKSGKSAAQILKELALEYLEDAQDIKEAEQVLKNIENGTDELLSLEEANKLLNELDN